MHVHTEKHTEKDDGIEVSVNKEKSNEHEKLKNMLFMLLSFNVLSLCGQWDCKPFLRTFMPG